MFDREATLYAFLLRYGRRLVADIEDTRLVDQPTAGVNHPAWLLGHLAMATDFALMMLGQPLHAPKRWFVLFGPGSVPVPDRSRYPSKAELWAALESGHARVTEAAGRADPELMGLPHGLELADYALALPTRADMLAHLMTTHEASHLGHLSNWRRQVGLPFLF